MPIEIAKEGKCYKVWNSESGTVYGKCGTKSNAEAQKRLLMAVDHGWKPTGRKSGGKVPAPITLISPKKVEKAAKGRKTMSIQMEGGALDEGIDVVNEQPIAHPIPVPDKKTALPLDTPATMQATTVAGTNWKSFLASKLKGKKFSSRSDINEAMRQASAEWKSKKGSGKCGGSNELLLAPGLGSGEPLSVVRNKKR